jgi:hypothetical protein
MKQDHKPLAFIYWPRVVRKFSGCWGWIGSFDSRGYGRICEHYGGRFFKAHRLSWFLHHGEWPNQNVLHRCDNPACTNPDHLFLGSHADNVADMVSKERHSRGEHRPNSKLTEAQVREIRERRAAGERRRDLANSFDVSEWTIQNIYSGKSWSWLS